MEPKKLHILFIEDNPGFAKLIQRQMEQRGYNVEVANNGREGLEIIDPDVHDVVVIDYNLPDLDGLQVLEAMFSRGITTPKIMITGFGSEEIAVKALKLGAADYLVKDVHSNYLELLPSVIERAVRQEQVLIEKTWADAARKQSEEKLRSVLMSLDDFMFVLDKKNTLVDYYWPVSINAMQLSFEVHLGKSLPEIFPENVAKILVGSIEAVKKTMQVQQFDFPMVLSGKERWFNAKVSEYQDNGGEFAGVTILARDVTERRALEKNLQENERKLKILFEDAPDGYFLIDLQGTFIDGNKAAERLVGYKKEELVGRNLFEMSSLPAAFVAKESDSPAAGNYSTPPVAVECSVNRKDGGQAVLEISTHPMKIGDRSLILSIARDISSRKKAQEKLHEQQNLLRTVFASTPDILFMKDKELRYRAVNRAFCHHVDKTEREIIGKTDFDLFPQQEAEFLHHGDLNVLQSKKPLTRNEHVCRNGKLLHFAVSRTPVLDSTGQPTGLVVSTSNITDLLEVTEELKEAKKEAEAANTAKSELLANMSHELRTPLTAIIGFSEIIEAGLAGAVNKKQKKYVKAIHESGKYLLKLIDDILDISKVEYGKMQLDLSEININKLVVGSIFMVKEKAAKHGVRIEIDIPENIGALSMKADERKLKQVLYNLLSNAVKFTPTGGSVTVGVDKEDEKLILFVKDTGIGIEPEEQEKIFGEFYQVKSNTASARTGTGLGLSLTKRLVELHGGRILVQSEGTAKGSRFFCVLPVKLVEPCNEGEP